MREKFILNIEKTSENLRVSRVQKGSEITKRLLEKQSHVVRKYFDF
jgi:hypothetical protein